MHGNGTVGCVAMAGLAIRTSVDGIDKMIASLQGLNRTLRNRVSRRIVMAASKEVSKAAKSLAPRGTGTLQRSQGVVIRTYGGVNHRRFVGVIGARSGYLKGRGFKLAQRETDRGKRNMGAALYQHLVIGGTRPHFLTKGSKKMRARKTLRGKFGQLLIGVRTLLSNIGTRKMHPGARPNPFLQRALQASKSQAFEAAKREFIAGLTGFRQGQAG